MFEKEAEEWVKENMDCCKTDNSVNKSIPYFDEEERCCAKSAFQDGAEFGYNKANEWHYVKDGDLPKDENLECLCIIRPMKEEGEPFENKDFRGVLFYRNKRFYLDENEGNDCLRESNSDFTDLVISWKEIALPKESE